LRVLITGGAGFIGRALGTHLQEAGHQVAVTTREVHAGQADDLPRLRYRIGVDAPAAVLELFGGTPDVVVHFAGPSNVWQTERDGEAARQLIVQSAREWVQALRDVARPSAPVRFVHGGSCHQYGDTIAELGPQMREDMTPRPNSIYARAKLEAEALALSAAGGGLEVIAARAFNHVGIGQKPDFFLPSLVRRVRRARQEGLSRIQTGALGVVRDLIDVRDGARAYAHLAERGQPDRVYNVGSGRGLRLRAAVTTLLQVLDAEELIVEELPDLGAGRRDLGDHFADITRLRTDTGFSPRYELADTIESVRATQKAAEGQGG
jgi:GDP-4-dehydro-6-deoxy-D-mannose reductase